MESEGGPLEVSAIYAAHVEFVWSVLSRLGVRDTDLEDQTQNVFLVVHRRLHTYDGTSRVRTWLFGIATRVASPYHRTRSRRHEAQIDAVKDDTLRASGNSPEEETAARQHRALLDRILDAMEIEKRAVFVMFEIEEMSCAGIATLMEVPVGTVYSRLHSARKAFAAAMQEQQREPGQGGVR